MFKCFFFWYPRDGAGYAWFLPTADEILDVVEESAGRCSFVFVSLLTIDTILTVFHDGSSYPSDSVSDARIPCITLLDINSPQ
jgi:hypothetical protein